MAGESAREMARRRRVKAERLTRVADAYEKGADGERQTAHALAMLPTSAWFVLHDVRWPGRRFANIDHVVVGPGGVFVIDSKAWSGRVEVRDRMLRQNGYKRESAVSDAAEAAMAVAEQVPGLDPYAVKPVLCFVGDHHIEGWCRDVMLCTPQSLLAMLLSRPPVMDVPTVRRTLLQLQQSLAGATSAPTRPAASPRRQQSARRSARSRRPFTWRLVFGVAVIFAALVGSRLLVEHSDDIAEVMTPKLPSASSSSPQGHHSFALGVPTSIPSATDRPPLRVTAAAALTVHRVGSSPYLFHGNRFFGVRLTILNTGRRRWVSEPGTAYQVTESSGLERDGDSAIHIREGRMLPDPLRLAPGHRVTGYVVFQVAADEPVTTLSMTVGPGKPHTVRWRVDRQ